MAPLIVMKVDHTDCRKKAKKEGVEPLRLEYGAMRELVGYQTGIEGVDGAVHPQREGESQPYLTSPEEMGHVCRSPNQTDPAESLHKALDIASLRKASQRVTIDRASVPVYFEILADDRHSFCCLTHSVISFNTRSLCRYSVGGSNTAQLASEYLICYDAVSYRALT